jgi:monovalent cation:H+ antiporter-2, CPA2 family
VPWILDHVARLKSRELFTLAVLAIALGIATGASALTGASLALGAFLAGMVVGQSELSLQAAADALPLRDAFAVLFFVSVGMLFDPTLIVSQRGLLLATLGLVVLVKPAIALVLVLALGHSLRSALTVAVGLAQIGEFSFVLAGLGHELGLLPPAGQSVILAVALASIALNPLLFRLIAPVDARLRGNPWLARVFAGPLSPEGGIAGEELSDHVVLCGYGRVGAMLRQILARRSQRFVVIEQDQRLARELRAEELEVIRGDAANPLVLEHAGVARARALVIGFADPVATRLAIDHSLEINPRLRVLARASSVAEEETLLRRARVGAVVGEREAALELARLYLLDDGAGAIESEALLMDLRRSDGLPSRTHSTRVVEVKVPPGSRASGRPLRDLGLPSGARVMLVAREGPYVVPQGDTELGDGDRILVLADDENLAIVETLLLPRGE